MLEILILASIVFTDESTVTQDGIINLHNDHHWAEDNPHDIVQSKHQQQLSINMWAGIIGDNLIGPFVLPARLTGELYCNFLRENLNELLEEVPLNTIQWMWFMHDGTPAHFIRAARNFLNERFDNRWIGREGPTAWPARSPDLNPLDFYLWNHLKTIVYARPIENAEDLLQRVEQASQTIRQTAGIFQRIRDSIQRCYKACIEAQGGHFEHFL
ncbi:hypothetical protein X777_01160 [Ooceraea biroi]|uniref:Tc1-like transposase DDE domain-containing protein n=1 Tax=Ooceraea biroi TaxID=2015173 RepID=A0A026X3G4_OOCBI|nr:hypothetical protein X777_01160 [Ooceraea biroi]